MKRLYCIFIITILYYNVFSQELNSRKYWENYFNNNINTLNPIEGIWSASYTMKIYDSYNRLQGDNYQPLIEDVVIQNIGGQYHIKEVGQKDSYGIFEATAVKQIYLYRGNQYNIKATVNLIESGVLQYSLQMPLSQIKNDLGYDLPPGTKIILEYKLIKIYPR